MATIKIKQKFEVLTSSGWQVFGDDPETTVNLVGDGKVMYQRYDNVDTSTTAQNLWLMSGGPLPSGGIVFAVRASVDGFVCTSDVTGNAHTSSIGVLAGVWTLIGKTANIREASDVSAADRAMNGTFNIESIVYKAASGTSADVEILGVI